MKVEMEDWKNGWYGIEIGLSSNEIDGLVRLLLELRKDSDQHFHISNGYVDEGGVGDITIYVKTEDVADNMSFSGPALQPGDVIELS